MSQSWVEFQGGEHLTEYRWGDWMTGGRVN
jgi:hypothetical protein